MPSGVRPAAISLAAWKDAFATPSLMAIVAVTFLFGAGQFTLFAYFTPYFRDVLHATTNQSSLLADLVRHLRRDRQPGAGALHRPDRRPSWR